MLLALALGEVAVLVLSASVESAVGREVDWAKDLGGGESRRDSLLSYWLAIFCKFDYVII